MITRDDVKHVAQLAKLSFDEETLDQFTPAMQDIIHMVEKLQAINTDGVKPTFHGNQLHNVYREDIAVQSDHYQDLLANAPAAQDGYIQVPVIIEEGEGA